MKTKFLLIVMLLLLIASSCKKDEEKIAGNTYSVSYENGDINGSFTETESIIFSDETNVIRSFDGRTIINIDYTYTISENIIIMSSVNGGTINMKLSEDWEVLENTGQGGRTYYLN